MTRQERRHLERLCKFEVGDSVYYHKYMVTVEVINRHIVRIGKVYVPKYTLKYDDVILDAYEYQLNRYNIGTFTP